MENYKSDNNLCVFKKSAELGVASDSDGRLLFLSKMSAKNEKEVLNKSIMKAYDDLKRTVIGIAKYEDKELIKGAAINLLHKALKYFLENEINDYDEWHCELIFQLKKAFRYDGFTIGQAQKWLNMSMKYLYCFSYKYKLNIPESKFSCCHIPIDSYVMGNAEKWYGIPRLPVPWSKLNDYDTYMTYQTAIKELSISENTTPLELDFILWKPLSGN